MTNADTAILNNLAAEPVRSVYVHVPFCQHRCGYCDFAIVAGRNELVPRYLNALSLELARQFCSASERIELDTLYIGGGTPTLLSADELQSLLTLLQQFFVLGPDEEFTFEANPDRFTPEKQDVLSEAGVNRISLGIQSFDDNFLTLLERTHSAAEAEQVYRQTLERFENVSIDLIFALPGQTAEHWEQTLERAISWQPAHISTYALTFEKGTSFWGQREKGTLAQVADDLETNMYERAMAVLPAAGLQPYEISNFARPGRESRHNQIYWTGKPFYAFGPGAAAFVGNRRSVNHRSPFTWMKRLEQDESPVDLVDDLSTEERARELFAVGLRRVQGVDLSDILARTGCDMASILQSDLQRFEELNWLEKTKSGYRLTPAGRLYADSIAAEVI
ncbi:MAG: radical SAM family heme chaperone HemW [Rubinisphaera brasiliensis]|uniref:radical SAM family heme chaperone HemW n=1 Tax=Rubinisphaera brasiliensis TaxID=119 RepID=UPI003919D746